MFKRSRGLFPAIYPLIWYRQHTDLCAGRGIEINEPSVAAIRQQGAKTAAGRGCGSQTNVRANAGQHYRHPDRCVMGHCRFL